MAINEISGITEPALNLLAQIPQSEWGQYGLVGAILGVAVAGGWRFSAFIAPHVVTFFKSNVDMTAVLKEQSIRQTDILDTLKDQSANQTQLLQQHSQRLDDHGTRLTQIWDHIKPK